MYIKQLSVFVENKFGRLTEILNTIKNVNISALSMADTSEFGLLRLIVNDPDGAKKVLDDSGVVVKVTDVLAFEIPDVPGGLANVMNILTDNKISVEYMYAFSGRNDKGAMDVIKTDDMEKAIKVLNDAGVEILTQADVSQM